MQDCLMSGFCNTARGRHFGLEVPVAHAKVEMLLEIARKTWLIEKGERLWAGR